MTKFGYYLTLLALFFSPFYFWESGLPQIAHLIMTLAMFINFISLFAFYTLLVNLFVYVKYFDINTLYASCYYIFNIFVWFHLVLLGKKIGPHRFLRTIWVLLWFLLLFELFLILARLGRLYGNSRAMGTFNDPNQMAHWLDITTFLVIWNDRRSFCYNRDCFFVVSLGRSRANSGFSNVRAYESILVVNFLVWQN